MVLEKGIQRGEFDHISSNVSDRFHRLYLKTRFQLPWSRQATVSWLRLVFRPARVSLALCVADFSLYFIPQQNFPHACRIYNTHYLNQTKFSVCNLQQPLEDSLFSVVVYFSHVRRLWYFSSSVNHIVYPTVISFLKKTVWYEKKKKQLFTWARDISSFL